MKFLIPYLIVVNAAAFLLMLIDKIKAKKKMWRIPERVLLGVSAIGGSIGGLLGMQLFRHKTKHWYFKFGMPLILFLQLLLIFYFAA